MTLDTSAAREMEKEVLKGNTTDAAEAYRAITSMVVE